MSRLSFFVSSTIEDLSQERAAVCKVLKSFGFDVFASEHQSARAKTPKDVCLEAVSDCDVLVLICGKKYGYKPADDDVPGSPYDGKTSATEGEFLRARELRKPILVFVKDVSREAAEKRFVSSLGDFLHGDFRTKFKDANELRRELRAAVTTLLVQLVHQRYAPPWTWRPNVIVAPNADAVARIGAKILAFAIRNRKDAHVGLFAGQTAESIYSSFFRDFEKNDMKNLASTRFFSVTEHFGIGSDNPSGYYRWFHRALFDKIEDLWHIKVPDANKHLVPSSISNANLDGFRTEYDQSLRIDRVDVQLISPAPNGQVISIDPNSMNTDEMLSMGASLVTYSNETAAYLVPASPHNMDIVIGMGNLLHRSERLVMFAFGKNKANVVRRMVVGPAESDCPASLVSSFPNVERLLFVIDKAAAKELPEKLGTHVRKLEENQWGVIWNQPDAGELA